MKLVALLFFVCYFAIQFLANSGQDFFINDIKNSLPYGDKVGHFFIYGLLALVVNYALKFRYFAGILLNQYGTLFILALSITEECSQLFITTRTFSLLDLVANFSGIMVFTWLSLKFGVGSAGYKQGMLNSQNPI